MGMFFIGGALLEMVIEANEQICLLECDPINHRVSDLVNEKFKEISYVHISVISEYKIRNWAVDDLPARQDM